MSGARSAPWRQHGHGRSAFPGRRELGLVEGGVRLPQRVLVRKRARPADLADELLHGVDELVDRARAARKTLTGKSLAGMRKRGGRGLDRAQGLSRGTRHGAQDAGSRNDRQRQDGAKAGHGSPPASRSRVLHPLDARGAAEVQLRLIETITIASNKRGGARAAPQTPYGTEA